MTALRIPIRIFIAVTTILMATTSVAQAEPAPDESVERPTIGLVLGGGGARGGAHVGVLKRLEELRIPIDYVVGTSIGSIVGGLYASGLSPDQMSDVIQGVDWIDVFDDKSDRRNLPIRRKQEDYIDLFAAELGISKHGLRLPAGLVAGQKLEFLLRELTLHVASVENFDDMNIPFRAVATDLETGDPVVLGSGDLADAMRASMAIPAFFTPAEIDDRQYVDGGVIQNLPVETMQALGADIIIAVDVGTPPGELGDNLSLLGVAQRTMSVMGAINVKRSIQSLGEEDVLLVPDLSAVSTLEFEKMDHAERRGMALVDSLESTLAHLSVSVEVFQEYLDRQRSQGDPFRIERNIDRITIEGNERVPSQVIMKRLKSRPGTRLNLELLRQDLQKIYQIGEFDLVDFHFRDRLGEQILVIQVREKSWGPDYLRMGLRLSGNFQGNARFILNFLHHRNWVNRYGAEWRNVVSIGDLINVRTEFDQPIGYMGNFFVSPIFNYLKAENGVYIDPGHKQFVRGWTYTGRFDVGFRAGNDLELRAGLLKGRIDARDESDESVPDIDDNLGVIRYSLLMDDIDSMAFPTRGLFVAGVMDLGRRWLDSTHDYDRLQVELLGAFNMGRSSISSSVDVGANLDTKLPGYEKFTLGGLFQVSGLSAGQLRGDSKFLWTLTYKYKIKELNPMIGRGVFAGATFETGNVQPTLGDLTLSSLIPAAAVMVGADTVAGPFILGFGMAEGGHESVYMLLGNPRRYRFMQ